MIIPYASQSSRPSGMGHPATGRVAGTESQGNIAVPFTRGEKIALWALVAAFIAPVTTWDGKLFLATEIAMMAFVAVAHRRVNRLARVLPLLAVLAVPLAFAFRFRPSGFSLLIAGLVYVKLVVFTYFVYILVERCRNTANVGWLAKNVILLVALVLCLSALVDRYTEWPFFVEWHQRVTYVSISSTLTRLIRDHGSDPELLEQLAGVQGKAGFATRPSDIPPWALLGSAAAYWLRQSGRMKTSTFLGLTLVLMAASFSMPKRSSVITIGVAVLAFLLLARTRADKRWKVAIFVLTAGVAVVSNWTAVRYIVNLTGDPTAAKVMGSITRLLSYGITQDMRYEMISLEIEWVLNNPRVLFLGTGWDLAGGLWSKPHNTYIALMVGGGLYSLLAVVIAVAHLFRRPMAERGQGRPGVMGVALLIALCVEIGMNGYLFYRLEFPASTLAMWIAWSAILYRTPSSMATDADVERPLDK